MTERTPPPERHLGKDIRWKNSIFNLTPTETLKLKVQSSRIVSFTRVKELLYDFAFSCRQALVQVAHTVGQSLFQG